MARGPLKRVTFSARIGSTREVNLSSRLSRVLPLKALSLLSIDGDVLTYASALGALTLQRCQAAEVLEMLMQQGSKALGEAFAATWEGPKSGTF